MKIFLLQSPILNKIKTITDAYLQTIMGPGRPVWKVQYLDYEPDGGYVLTLENDGAIAVYARTVSFPPSKQTLTGVPETDNTLVVDCYGFGDPVKDENDIMGPSARDAQRRAQILVTLAYRAIMDRQEVQGSATVPKWYDSGIDIDARTPMSITKGSPIGNMETKRAVCVYRAEFKFEFSDDVPAEALGEDYAGQESLDNDTFEPGSEPG